MDGGTGGGCDQGENKQIWPVLFDPQDEPAFIDHEIHQRSGGRMTGFGDILWQHGHLLLLLDGLDEIADAGHRAEVLRHIGWALGQEGMEGLRAVVACRRVGLLSVSPARKS